MLLAPPEALELRDDAVTDGRSRAAVAGDGSVVGFITVLPGKGSVLQLEDLFVDPDWMRQGVARSLLADVLATARRDGCACIEVTANPHADGFYRSVGFEPMHECETPFGSALRMQLAIPRKCALARNCCAPSRRGAQDHRQRASDALRYARMCSDMGTKIEVVPNGRARP